MGVASLSCIVLFFGLYVLVSVQPCIESDTKQNAITFTLYHAINTRRYKNKYKAIQEGVVLHGILPVFGNRDTDSDKTEI